VTRPAVGIDPGAGCAEAVRVVARRLFLEQRPDDITRLVVRLRHLDDATPGWFESFKAAASEFVDVKPFGHKDLGPEEG